MSPYIVTKRNWDRPRCAVAMLGQAREAVIDATPEEIGKPAEVFALAEQIKGLTEQGGTITLPDGTIIEVEPTDWAELASAAEMDDPAMYEGGVSMDEEKIILAAFNEAQGGPR